MVPDENNPDRLCAHRQKRSYVAPRLRALGTVAELTRGTGQSLNDVLPPGTQKPGSSG
jgi:hypothetical protein